MLLVSFLFLRRKVKLKISKGFFVFILAIIVFQFSFFGLKYFVTMDDNNQMGVYHLRSDDIGGDVISRYKSYDVRPFAFIFDAYVFSWFWDNMYALLILMIVFHVANLYLTYKICKKIGVNLSGFCICLFALCPILVEAIYWISASTRIVFSLFLCLSSIYLLLKSFDETNDCKRLVCFYSAILLNLICVGFYEQVIALNLFLFIFVMICLKKYKYIWIPITSTVWIGIWYVYFMMHGEMQARGALNISGMFGTAINCVKMIFKNYVNAYSNFIYSLGFGKEAMLGSLVTILIAILFIAFIVYVYKKKVNVTEKCNILRKIIFALIWIIVPFLPFIVLDTKFIAVRNLYFCTFGIAILFEVLVDYLLLIFKNDNAKNMIKTAVLAFITFFFIISNVDGVNNYGKVNLVDEKVTRQIIQNVPNEAFEEGKSISINYDANELFKYKNLSLFVESTVESDWATIGKIQVMRKSTSVPTIYINSNQDKADYVLYFDGQMNLVKN